MKALKTILFLMLPALAVAQFTQPIKSLAVTGDGITTAVPAFGKIEIGFNSSYHNVVLTKDMSVKFDPDEMTLLHAFEQNGNWEFYSYESSLILIGMRDIEVTVFVYNASNGSGFAACTVFYEDWQESAELVFRELERHSVNFKKTKQRF